MFIDYFKCSKQKLFDTVALHLLKQGERSTKSGHCMYRGANKLKCAIGVLIDDSEYTCDMENKSPQLLFRCGYIPGIAVDIPLDKIKARLKMMRELQLIHDGAKPHAWARKLKEFARENKLRVTAINKFLKEQEQSK